MVCQTSKNSNVNPSKLLGFRLKLIVRLLLEAIFSVSSRLCTKKKYQLNINKSQRYWNTGIIPSIYTSFLKKPYLLRMVGSLAANFWAKITSGDTWFSLRFFCAGMKRFFLCFFNLEFILTIFFIFSCKEFAIGYNNLSFKKNLKTFPGNTWN